MMMQSQALRSSTVHGQKVVSRSSQRSSAIVGRTATVQVQCRTIEAGMVIIHSMQCSAGKKGNAWCQSSRSRRSHHETLGHAFFHSIDHIDGALSYILKI